MATKKPLANYAGTTQELSAGDTIPGTSISNVPAGNIAATTVQDAINELDAEKVSQTSSVGAAILPAGATTDRPGTPAVGYIRYNNTLGSYEGYGAAGWAPIGGGGGGVNWQIKTANYTAVSGERIVADTSGGAFTVNLPASPSAGNYVEFSDGGGAFQTNNLTISRNGNTIMGLSEDMTLSTNNVSVGLVYNGTTWRIY